MWLACVAVAKAVPTVRALGSVVADSVANQRFEMDLLLLFAVSAAVSGGTWHLWRDYVFLVQRHREIGLRIALGAQRASVYGLVLRDGLFPVAVGAVAGVAVAFASARMVRSLLFEVSPSDPMLAIGAFCVLLATGVAASLVPARRAASVDPMQALRTE